MFSVFKFIRVYFTLFLFISYLFGSWAVLNLPPSGRLSAIEAIFFVTPDTGYISIHSVGNFGLWKTNNGGSTFQNVTPQTFCHTVGYTHYYTSLQFFNDTGYLCGWLPDTPVAKVRLWKTTDGGSNWNDIFLAPADRFLAEPGPNLCFVNSNYGYLTVPGSCSLYKTTDGGMNWISFMSPGVFTELYFVDSLVGFALNREAILWKTTDGGLNWSQLYTFNGYWFDGIIQFLTRDLGYLSISIYDGLKGTLFKTIDGGRNWERLLYKSSDISGIFFTTIDTGYVALSEGKIYKTTNGNNFFRLALPIHCEGISSLYFIKGTQVGYLSCEVYEPRITFLLKTVDGGGNESLGFWQKLTTLPEIPKKGVLLASPPETQSLFALEKGPNKRLWVYDIPNDSWYQKRPIPVEIKEGAITSDWEGLVVIKEKSNECWFYNIENDSWLKLANIPGETLVKKGSCITSDGGNCLYVLKGNKTKEFWQYDKEVSQWQRKPDIPGASLGRGAAIACDGEYVYAIKGGKANEFWAYDIAGDSWHRLPDIYGKGFKDGSCLAANPYIEEKGVLGLKGGSQECWYYGSYWKLLPGLPGKKKIKKGAQLTVDEHNNFYALKGKKMSEIWLTDELSSFQTESYEQEAVTDNIQSEVTDSGLKDEIKITNPTNKTVINLGVWDRISVYDITGRLIKTVSRQGEKNLELKLQQGVYLIRIKTGNLALTKKLIVTR
ncbi:MAG: T9SS type A sorting domain-containing protein [candidate division WOR-3 bacterium]